MPFLICVGGSADVEFGEEKVGRGILKARGIESGRVEVDKMRILMKMRREENGLLIWNGMVKGSGRQSPSIYKPTLWTQSRPPSPLLQRAHQHNHRTPPPSLTCSQSCPGRHRQAEAGRQDPPLMSS
jgi:hypothetical protein